MELRRTVLVLAAIAIMVGLLVPCRLRLESIQSDKAGDFFVFLPDGKALRYFAAGYQSVLADYYWLRGIAYIQSELDRSGKYERMPKLYDLITELDPDFEGAYIWGSLFTSALAREPNASIALLEKGLERLPWSWQIPYHLAEIYLVDLGDMEKGGEYMRIAAGNPRAPELVRKFAAGLGTAEERYSAKALEWIETWDKSDNDIEKETARNRVLASLRWGNRDLLIKVVEMYREQYGKDPQLIRDLLDTGELSVHPETGKLIVRFDRSRRLH